MALAAPESPSVLPPVSKGPRIRQQICDEVAQLCVKNAAVLHNIDEQQSQFSYVPKKNLRSSKKTQKTWADEFSARCRAREDLRRRQLELPKETAPATTKETKQIKELKKTVQEPAALTGQLWQPGWRRNKICEYCLEACEDERVECRYCNVVAHVDCASKAYDDGILLQKTKVPGWVCVDCAVSFEDRRREQIVAVEAHVTKLMQTANTITIQSRMRTYLHNQPFRKLKNNVVAIQGTLRVFAARRRFRQQYTNQERPYHVKIHDLTNCDGDFDDVDGDERACVVSIVRGDSVVPENASQSSSGKPGMPVRDVAPGTTMYQWTTKFEKVDNNSVTYDATFLVPSTVCDVKVYVTMMSQRKSAIDDEPPTFRGQAVWDLQDDLLFHRRTQKDLVLTTEGKHFEPRERAGVFAALRMLPAPPLKSAAPSVTVEVIPCPRASTHWGFLDEVCNAFSRKSVKRRWWCLLLDHHFAFYRNMYDQTPTHTFLLWRAQMKLYPQSGVLEVRCLEKLIFVSSSNPNTRSAWFDMLKKNFDSSKTKALVRHHYSGPGSATRRGSLSMRRPSFTTEDLSSVIP